MPWNLQVFALGQGVADFEVPGVVEADHIAGIGLVHHRFGRSHKRGRVRELQLFVESGVLVEGAAFEGATADPQKSNPVPVPRVDVGVDLENEAAELSPLWVPPRAGWWSGDAE